MDEQKFTQVNVWLEKRLHKLLKAQAKESYRSMYQQLNKILSEYFGVNNEDDKE